MGKIIIVEGIDRVGKTTLCNKIHEEINLPIFKYDSKLIKREERTNRYETDKTLLTLELCNLFHSFIIFDRLHLSDYVYGIIQRQYDVQEATKNFMLIENYLEDMKDEVILLLVTPTDIQRSSREHGSDLSRHEKLFEEIYNKSKIKNKMKCNYNTLNEVINFIRSTINCA